MSTFRLSTLAYVLLSEAHGPFRVRDDQQRHTVWDHHGDRSTLETWEDIAEVLSDDDAYLQIEAPVTAWGDHHGTDVSRANWNALQADFPGVFNAYDRYDGYFLWVDAIVHHDEETPDVVTDLESAESLAAGLAGLRDDYPLWSEEALSSVEEELTNEAWDSWLGSDIVSILTDAAYETPAEAFLDAINGQSIYEPFWSLYTDSGSNAPYAESATSIVIPELESTARELAARFVAGWRPGMPLFPCAGCGEETYGSWYMTRHGADCPQQSLPIAI